jgi:hypothetical protein
MVNEWLGNIGNIVQLGRLGKKSDCQAANGFLLIHPSSFILHPFPYSGAPKKPSWKKTGL